MVVAVTKDKTLQHQYTTRSCAKSCRTQGVRPAQFERNVIHKLLLIAEILENSLHRTKVGLPGTRLDLVTNLLGYTPRYLMWLLRGPTIFHIVLLLQQPTKMGLPSRRRNTTRTESPAAHPLKSLQHHNREPLSTYWQRVKVQNSSC